ncbi:MFS transporter [uncultured Methanolobus sp.]|uniref:MFS transporter n=1 Tax=uncultured Methanolobus sp. TaxID=218300 RepID=UPI0029C84D1B|nr:MFS transporter [uncultured Methanolobus sp.]
MDKNRLLLYFTVFLIMGLSNAVIPVLPEIAASGEGSAGVLASSLLFSGYFIGALVMMLPFGLLSDRYNGLRLVVFSILMTLVSGIVLLVSENLLILVLARLVEGVACGAFFPVAYAMLSEYEEKSRYIGELNFFLNAGLALGVVLAGYLVQWYIKGGIFIFTAMALLFLIAGAMIMIQDHRSHETSQKVRLKEPDIPGMRTIAGHVTNAKHSRIWIITFLLFGITGVVIAFYPEYSQETLSKTVLGISIAAMYVSAMIANIVVGRSNLHYKQMVRAGITISATGTLLTIVHPLSGFALIGVGTGTGMVGLPLAVTNMRIQRGLAMGIFNTCIYAGIGLMPVFAGVFLGILGFEAIFAAFAILLLLSLLIKDRLKSVS